MEDDGRGCCSCCCCGDDDPAEAVTIFNSAPMLACTFDNRFGNSLANRPKVPSRHIFSNISICMLDDVEMLLVPLLLLLLLLKLLKLLMFANDRVGGR